MTMIEVHSSQHVHIPVRHRTHAVRTCTRYTDGSQNTLEASRGHTASISRPERQSLPPNVTECTAAVIIEWARPRLNVSNDNKQQYSSRVVVFVYRIIANLHVASQGRWDTRASEQTGEWWLMMMTHLTDWLSGVNDCARWLAVETYHSLLTYVYTCSTMVFRAAAQTDCVKKWPLNRSISLHSYQAWRSAATRKLGWFTLSTIAIGHISRQSCDLYRVRNQVELDYSTTYKNCRHVLPVNSLCFYHV